MAYNEIDLSVEQVPQNPIEIAETDSSNYNDLLNKPAINGVILEGNKTGAQLGFIVDSSISATSENPVQNKVIKTTLDGYTTTEALSAALAEKQDTLVSGTNIKTVNNNSLLGSGNLTIDPIPSQTGHSGQFLTTDGTTASWANIYGKSIGEVYYSQSATAADNPGGLPLFTGETIANADQLYPDFYNWVADHSALQISAADYATMLTAFGECPKYVIDTDNKTIRLPKISSQKRVLVDSKAPTAQDTSWYNLYSDGWCEQGGIINSNGGTVTLAKTYADTNYSISISGKANSVGSSTNPIYIASVTASGFSASSGNEFTALLWRTAGYVAGTSPERISYPWVCAYNAAVAASTAQAAQFQTALSGKSDTNLENIVDAGKAVIYKTSVASDTFEQLTVGTNFSAYVAPADGEFYAFGKGSAGQYMMLYKNSSMDADSDQTLSTKGIEMVNVNGHCSIRLRVKAGDVVHFGYDVALSYSGFSNMGLYFRYANSNDAQ